MNNIHTSHSRKRRKHNQQNTGGGGKQKTLEICEHRYSDDLAHRVPETVAQSEKETQEQGSENQHCLQCIANTEKRTRAFLKENKSKMQTT
jgi:hypothetical protein